MEHDAIPYLREALIFLAAAGIVVPLLHRVGVAPTLGYLLVGIAVGPHGLGALAAFWPALHAVTISETEGVRAVAELGVVLLLFTIGVELSFDRVVSMRRQVFALGVAQVAVTAVILAVAAAALLALPAPLAGLVGFAFALSSTAIVVQFLTETRRLSAPAGRAAFGVLLFQDLAVVPALFVLTAVRGGEAIPTAIVLGILKAAGAIALIVAFGRLVLRPILRLGGGARGPEAFLASTMLIALATATITGLAGLSMALGAFLAGLLVAESEYRHAVEAGIAPLKGLLLGLFFAAVGLQIDFGFVWLHLPTTIGAVVALYLVKGAVVLLLARALGLSLLVALETALLLGQVGEFAFLLLGAAATFGPGAAALRDGAFAVAGMSLLAAPAVAALGRRLVLALERRLGATGAEMPALDDHVVVIGYGRVGRLLGDVLAAEGVAHIAFDADPANVAAARKDARPVWYGDARDAELLRSARLDVAQALVIAIDEAEAAETIVAVARGAWPELAILARARDVRHARRLLELGATEVVPENLEAGLRLAGRLLDALGAPEDAVARRLDAVRREAGATVRPRE